MTLDLFFRIALSIMYLVFAICGPIAIIMLRRFIYHYTIAHAALEARVTQLERQYHDSQPPSP